MLIDEPVYMYGFKLRERMKSPFRLVGERSFFYKAAIVKKHATTSSRELQQRATSQRGIPNGRDNTRYSGIQGTRTFPISLCAVQRCK